MFLYFFNRDKWIEKKAKAFFHWTNSAKTADEYIRRLTRTFRFCEKYKESVHVRAMLGAWDFSSRLNRELNGFPIPDHSQPIFDPIPKAK